VPVVLVPEEVAKLLPLLGGEPQVIVKLLYGSGLRIMEAVRLRIKDIDLLMKQVTVRSGKGDKDRFTNAGRLIDTMARNQMQKLVCFISKTWPPATARYIYPMRWNESTLTRLKNGPGSTCSQLVTFRRILSRALSAGTMSIQRG